MAVAQNISAFRGRTLDLDMAVTLDGTARDLTTDTLTAYLKASADVADGSALVTLTEGSGITVTDAVGGLLRITFSDTNLTQPEATYFYHVTLATAAGALYSLAHGLVLLQQT